MKKEIVRITEREVLKCTEFACQSVGTSLAHYAKRGQTNQEKIINDIITGKLGEVAAYKMLKRKGIDVKYPDFEIYEGRKKSFDADMTDEQGRKYHCKSQSNESAKRYGCSWILQYSGTGHGHQDKLFRNRDKNDFLVPMRVDIDAGLVTIFGVIGVELLFEQGFIKKPTLEWFARTKRAVYLNDLSTLIWKYRWGTL